MMKPAGNEKYAIDDTETLLKAETLQRLKDETLDPDNWREMRKLGHEMVDVMFDYLKNQRSRPVWTKPPAEVKKFLSQPLPQDPEGCHKPFADFVKYVLPYNKGNVHPRFWAWVEGASTPFGMLSEMLAAGMNSNVSMGDHAAVYVEHQVLNWIKEFLHFPESSSGILVSGGSMANLTGIAVGRNNFSKLDIKNEGLLSADTQLITYGSRETHSCVEKALEVLGMGSKSFRKIGVLDNYIIDIEQLERAIAEDRKRGNIPFCIIGNAGTVNTGAIDPLAQLSEIAKREGMWFHIDGAFGAYAVVVPEYKTIMKGLPLADSIAIDLHKWMSMPYEVGCVLINNPAYHKNTFFKSPEYLLPHERGIAAGPDPFNFYGVQLSRGFRALKVWLSLKEHGAKKHQRIIRQNISHCFYLEELIKQQDNLEMVTPVTLNIVCFRYRCLEADEQKLNILNKEILMTLHERGIAAPSYTFLKGHYCIRVGNVNHRSKKVDFEILVKAVVEIGNELSGSFV